MARRKLEGWETARALVDSFLDDDAWMRRHRGETPGSISRAIAGEAYVRAYGYGKPE
jgi:hypothetical protein